MQRSARALMHASAHGWGCHCTTYFCTHLRTRPHISAQKLFYPRLQACKLFHPRLQACVCTHISTQEWANSLTELKHSASYQIQPPAGAGPPFECRHYVTMSPCCIIIYAHICACAHILDRRHACAHVSGCVPIVLHMSVPIFTHGNCRCL